MAVLFDITERKSPYNKPFSAGGGGGGGGGGAGARLAWCGGRVKTHIVCTSVGMKTNRSPRVFSYCRTTSEPGEEVVAAKVLEPPGPGVVEEGGQAPDHDDDCACEETFFMAIAFPMFGHLHVGGRCRLPLYVQYPGQVGR